MNDYFTEDQICIALYNGDMLHIPESQLANPIPIVLEQYKMSHNNSDEEIVILLDHIMAIEISDFRD